MAMPGALVSFNHRLSMFILERFLVYRQWWTQWHGQTDADGRCRVRAFFGQYCIQAGAKTLVTDLRKSDGSKTVQMK